MPVRRTLFSADHEIFRSAVRRFVETELKPRHASWEEEGVVPRSAWLAAGAAGLLCCNVPEAYGGPGCDFLFNAVVIEELARAGISGPGFFIQTDMVAPYLLRFGSEAQKLRWLPPMVRGEAIGAIAITEPDAGSDVRGIRTTARRDGGDYVIHGQKTYISNGQTCDVAVVAVKSDPERPRDAISLILVETDRPGFTRGRNLRKMGLHAQDTSELFFDNVRVPAENVLGELHQGFRYLVTNLAHERLVQAVRSCAVVEATLAHTIAYTRQRRAFGQTIADFQNTQFKLAELHAAAVAARIFVDRCIELAVQGELDPVTAAAAKLQLSELHCRTADECLQLQGSAGYMWEDPVCRAFADGRIGKIAGGSVEIMKQIIAREIFA